MAGAEEKLGRNPLRSLQQLRRCGLSGHAEREPCGKRKGRLPAAAMVRGRADGVLNPAAFLPETFFLGRRARSLLVEHCDSNTTIRTPRFEHHDPDSQSYSNNESTNSCGAKGSRSPAFSPTPTKRTGKPSSREMATTTPPLAVPSSLVSTMPVTPAAWVNRRACCN